MGDYIETKKMIVDVQQNGIIRSDDGWIIARLVDGVSYESLSSIPSPSEGEAEGRYREALERKIETIKQRIAKRLGDNYHDETKTIAALENKLEAFEEALGLLSISPSGEQKEDTRE